VYAGYRRPRCRPGLRHKLRSSTWSVKSLVVVNYSHLSEEEEAKKPPHEEIGIEISSSTTTSRESQASPHAIKIEDLLQMKLRIEWIRSYPHQNNCF